MKSTPNLRVIRATEEPRYVLPDERLWFLRQRFLIFVAVMGVLFTTGALSKAAFGTAWWSPVWVGWFLGIITCALFTFGRRKP